MKILNEVKNSTNKSQLKTDSNITVFIIYYFILVGWEIRKVKRKMKL